MGREFCVALVWATSMCCCIEANSRYCDETKPCVDPRWPVCDLEGRFDASGYTPNLCVEVRQQRRGGDDGGADVVMAEAGTDQVGSLEVTVPGDVSTASARLTVDPHRLDFGVVAVGGPPASQTLRVVNAGPQASGGLQLGMQGISDFEVAITDCVAILQPLEHCRVNVSYAPRDVGRTSAVLRLLADPGGELLVLLGGSGRRCGDDQCDSGEACDGADLAGQTCITLGFDGGTLSCDSNCKLDPSACTECGNGVIEAGEQCEGSGLDAEFGGRRCRDFVYRSSGDLLCSRCQVDFGACRSEPY